MRKTMKSPGEKIVKDIKHGSPTPSAASPTTKLTGLMTCYRGTIKAETGAYGLRDISSDRPLAILAVCAVEWRADIADAIVENHDRIVDKIWRVAKKHCDVQINDAKISR